MHPVEADRSDARYVHCTSNLQRFKLELPHTSSNLIKLGFTTLLVQLATMSVLEASTFCQMRRQQSPSGEAFMGQSMWSTFLNGSVFSPVPGREALRSLLTQTNELVGVMSSFKRLKPLCEHSGPKSKD